MRTIRQIHLFVLFVALIAFHAHAQQIGQQLFSSTCAACHGLDGRGGEHAPNIATDPRMQGLADRDLSHIIKAGLPNSGMPGFGATLNDDQIQAVMSYLRILQGKSKAIKLAGDSEKGRLLFFGTGQCSTCHTMNGTGGYLGADLSSYGGTHTPDEIRQAIVNPDKDQDRQHRAVVVVTKTGAKYTGVLRNEDNFSLQMQTPDGHFHLLSKSEIKSVQDSDKSMMPSDYQSVLGNAGIDDLISYLVREAATQSTHREDDRDE